MKHDSSFILAAFGALAFAAGCAKSAPEERRRVADSIGRGVEAPVGRPAGATEAPRPEHIPDPPPPKAPRTDTVEELTTETSILTLSDLSLRIGEVGTASVEIAPRPPWTINTEYPVKVILSGMTSSLPPCMRCSNHKPEGTQIQVTSGGARIDIPFTGDSPGTDRVTARVKYAVCRVGKCLPRSEEVSWRVRVSL